MNKYLRMRQLCLVAADLGKTVDLLCATLGAVVCFRDPSVARFGLQNALIRVGDSFIEVVSPIRPGTAAARYLERRSGAGGYMVILDTEDLDRWRRWVAESEVRVVIDYQHENFEGVQLHPRDTGGTLLEINHTIGGDDTSGAYGPAGMDWRSFANAQNVRTLAGAVLQSPDYRALSARWSGILRRPVEQEAQQCVIRLDKGYLRFVRATDGRGEGLAGVDLYVDDSAEIITVAQKLGCCRDDGSIYIGGIHVSLIHSNEIVEADSSK